MNWIAAVGRLLGLDDVQSVESVRATFGSAWAHSSPLLVCLGCATLTLVSYAAYSRLPANHGRLSRVILIGLRACLLCLLFVVLADPALELNVVRLRKPILWLLLDGSDSMSIPDKLSDEEKKSLMNAAGLPDLGTSRLPNTQTDDRENRTLSRVDYARLFLSKSNRNLVTRLSQTYRIRPFIFSTAQGVVVLNSDNITDGQSLANEWKTTGTSTAIGDTFAELATKNGAENLAGILIFSDFDQNVGVSPLVATKKMNVPIFTVGVGPPAAADVSVDLTAPFTIKRGELSTIHVTVRQRELDNSTVRVQLSAQPRTEIESGESKQVLIGQKDVMLDVASEEVDFTFTPEASGTHVLSARVDAVGGEIITENNTAEREVKVIDDFLRLMYVEYEPTWEWRFIKEVLHRDRLVGLRGFRTFIRSSDPIVRETNELFLPSLTLPRTQFFQNDVIFLGDMPADALSQRFCEMTKEFVGQFGGGLVVIAGPRFGPGQLARTPLADLLPVVVDADARRRDQEEFRLALTPIAEQYDFMRLGRTEADNQKAWDNLAKLNWYQPVRRVETQGTRVLAVHPFDKCIDGDTPQPLVAIRQYGRGEVVYIAFNEMWRLRRLHGEEFYRQFWGQLIHRLGLSHAIGSHKRFVVKTDKSVYRTGDRVVITVEAYDREFEPLSESQVADRELAAELIGPNREGEHSRKMGIPQLKRGVFETSISDLTGGEYRVQVVDPVTDEIAEVSFDVVNVSLERRNSVRNSHLQASLAAETGGRAYDLTTVDQFPDDFHPLSQPERSREIVTLWNHWPVFLIMIGLLITEWIVRKRLDLN